MWCYWPASAAGVCAHSWIAHSVHDPGVPIYLRRTLCVVVLLAGCHHT